MGFIFSKSMNENMKNQQEFMLMNARLQGLLSTDSMPGAILINEDIKDEETKLNGKATNDAERNERKTNGHADCLVSGIPQIFWNFFGIAAISLTAGAIRKKKPAFLFPIIPLSFIFTYQYDLGYGTLLQRMKGEAENILETEKSKLQLPRGMITFESLEKARREQSKFFIDK